ncbi:mono-functional DNA-alkylating methyl methanesulfonate N-term-domain-containing protein [Mycotypha africana]|uniref:mono-functional DNA-alkylating methyl methanesulfonate N-term-domain-containing protein n=1 Tax=Mycotypha africana TaxID=64632 RepID=UPI002301025A|nr:mono-functional DNA-alkylating methyl methanesulfonate N-term-domain-containing protein [Mycotypha africana]KAI8975445.1 mono-functional DNA-alkylating methyl methanesulfonate N-term-domain-containing protein [Mycotypha africana]
MEKQHYVVTTINEATAVNAATKGKFVSPTEDNLIICKGSIVEVYYILKDGISLVTKFSIYGTIAAIKPFSAPGSETCSLFILTNQSCYTIVHYSQKTKTIVTEASGMLHEPSARVADAPYIVEVHEPTYSILISMFTGYLFSIPYYYASTGGSSSRPPKFKKYQPILIKTNEYDILSMVSIRGQPVDSRNSAIATLVGVQDELKTIKTFIAPTQKPYQQTSYPKLTNNNSQDSQTTNKLFTRELEVLSETNQYTANVDATTHTLIAVPPPLGGVLSVGEYIIAYHNVHSSNSSPKEVSIDPVVITAYTFLKDSAWQCVLGDSEGQLYILTLSYGYQGVTEVNTTLVEGDRVCAPSTIIDLGVNNMFYIGSTQGDAMVIRLTQCAMQPLFPSGSSASNAATSSAAAVVDRYKLEIMSSFVNLGPIVDFCLYNYDETRQGKKTMVCCTGSYKDGSLCMVENGIGFIEKLAVNIPMIQNLWTIPSRNEKHTLFYVISSFDRTFAIKQQLSTIQPQQQQQQHSSTFFSTFFNKQQQQQQQQLYPTLTELPELGSLLQDEVTLSLSVMKKGPVLQVTPSTVRLFDAQSLLSEWKLNDVGINNGAISLARTTSDGDCIVYDAVHGMLVYLHCSNNTIQRKCITTMFDVACIYIESNDRYAILGFWSSATIKFLSLNNFEKIHEVNVASISSDVISATADDTTTIHAVGSTFVAPRDILVTEMEPTIKYLLIVFGDGQLLSYKVTYRSEKGIVMSGATRTMIGSHATGLYPYTYQNEPRVMIAGGRPTIISSTHGQLYFAAMNFTKKPIIQQQQQQQQQKSYHDRVYGLIATNQMFILWTNEGLLMGDIDLNQRLHHQKIRLNEGEAPIRVQYLKSIKSLAVGTLHSGEKDLNNSVIQKGSLQLMDAQTFQVYDKFNLLENEVVECMAVAPFDALIDNDYLDSQLQQQQCGEELLFIGTAIEDLNDPEACYGRVLAFRMEKHYSNNQQHKLEFLEEYKMNGVVYDLRYFPLYRTMLACVNGAIYAMDYFRPSELEGERMSFSIKLHRNVLALKMDVLANKVIVGDMMRSISLLNVETEDSSIGAYQQPRGREREMQSEPFGLDREGSTDQQQQQSTDEVSSQQMELLTITPRSTSPTRIGGKLIKMDTLALDFNPKWVTAVKFINAAHYMGADGEMNLFAMSFNRNSEDNDGKVAPLDLQGGYHLGSLVNTIKEGTLSDILSTQFRHNTNNEDDTAFGSLLAVTKSEPALKSPSFSFATVSGIIGSVKTITTECFEFFYNLQNLILQERRNIGKLDYNAYRAYRPKMGVEDSQEYYINSRYKMMSDVEEGEQKSKLNSKSNNDLFLDGDLLKQYHYLTREEKQQIAESLTLPGIMVEEKRLTVAQLEQLIQELLMT